MTFLDTLQSCTNHFPKWKAGKSPWANWFHVLRGLPLPAVPSIFRLLQFLTHFSLSILSTWANHLCHVCRMTLEMSLMHSLSPPQELQFKITKCHLKCSLWHILCETAVFSDMIGFLPPIKKLPLKWDKVFKNGPKKLVADNF